MQPRRRLPSSEPVTPVTPAPQQSPALPSDQPALRAVDPSLSGLIDLYPLFLAEFATGRGETPNRSLSELAVMGHSPDVESRYRQQTDRALEDTIRQEPEAQESARRIRQLAIPVTGAAISGMAEDKPLSPALLGAALLTMIGATGYGTHARMQRERARGEQKRRTLSAGGAMAMPFDR